MTATSSAAWLRIGDAEREAAVDALNRHFAEGRLTSLEHDERTSLALEARTRADLDKLFADLPRLDVAASHHPGASAKPGSRGPRAAGLAAQVFVTGAFLVVAVFVIAHLLPVFVLIALAIVGSRVAFGGRHGWHGRHWQGPRWQGPC